MPYTLYYTRGIQRGAINYQNETIVLSIEVNLHPNDTWADPLKDALVAVYDGLTQTGRKTDWGLAQWPYQRVTSLNPFVRRGTDFSVVIEIVNSNDKVIGRQTFQAGAWWEWGFRYQNQIVRPDVNVSDDVKKTLSYTVKVDDITDGLTIRVASVNGQSAETAAGNGILQAMAVYSIPRYMRVNNMITVYGSDKHRDKQLTNVTIPNGVTEIVSEFLYNQITSITIGANVKIYNNAFGNYFSRHYDAQGKKAGTYILRGRSWSLQ